MSDQEQSVVNSEQQQEQDQQNQDQQQDQDQDQDDDDQDQDDQDQQQQQQQQQQQGQQQQQQQQQKQQKQKLPTFKVVRTQPQQFKFTSLLSQISNLSNSVDNFIGSLSSSSMSNRRPYISNYQSNINQQYKPIKVQQVRLPQQSRVVIMKDQDTQVDMKPQIIIQPTKIKEQVNVVQARPYKIASESQKFLANLYQQNKKLKRWQNPTHTMNSYMTSFNQSNQFSNTIKSFIPNGKDKFQRKQYEKGLFNIDQRNKQIDQAILMLKRQEDNQRIPYNE